MSATQRVKGWRVKCVYVCVCVCVCVYMWALDKIIGYGFLEEMTFEQSPESEKLFSWKCRPKMISVENPANVKAQWQERTRYSQGIIRKSMAWKKEES